MIPNSQTITRAELPNGIVLLVYENHASPSFVMEGTMLAGAVSEPPQLSGLADLTSRMLMRGTEKRPFAQIYEELESNGASLGFGSGYHTISFSANALIEDFDLLLDMINQSLRAPTFPESQFSKLKGETLTRLQLQADDTSYRADETFRQLVYGTAHPYGRLPGGTPPAVSAITLDDVRAHFDRFIGPQQMILTVVGDVQPTRIVEQITAVLGDWHVPQQQQPQPVPDRARPNSRQRRDVPMADKAQADLVIGLPGPRRSDPDFLALSLANTVLGVFGMMGRIGQVVREEQGLAYYVYSRLSGGLGPAPFTAVAGVAPEDVDQAIDAILAQIERMQQELVPAEELEDCQSYRIGSMPLALETNGGLADVIGDLALYGLGLDYLSSFPEKIRAITAEQVQTAVQKHIPLDALSIAVAGV